MKPINTNKKMVLKKVTVDRLTGLNMVNAQGGLKANVADPYDSEDNPNYCGLPHTEYWGCSHVCEPVNMKI